jgi:magnesium chelatase family protein
MSFARTYSRALLGMQAPEVVVEVHLSNGLPSFNIVGLPETSVKESKDRVRSALVNSQFIFPDTRITVNLAPADLPKDGGRFDLAIAVGILLASGQLKNADIDKYEFYGELALSGEVRTVSAILPSIMAATSLNRCCFIPHKDDELASLIETSDRKAVTSLQEVWLDLNGQQSLPLNQSYNKENVFEINKQEFDICDVKGQQQGKRALEIAAAGSHNLLFLGPPGTGKSMLAQRMTGIMPEMANSEALETAAVYSITGQQVNLQNWKRRPFRNPHHTCSAVALVGGSSTPKPGEISLSHNGVLFLDELPEFDRKVLDSLREPMETGKVMISRAARQSEFPARFQLIAALNPSPTGCHTDKRASPDQILKYLSKISGPFIDRVDLQVELPKLSSLELQSQEESETSQQVKYRVDKARKLQLLRQNKANAHLTNKEISKYCILNEESLNYLAKVSEKLGLSPRSYHRIIKVSRTIADLNACQLIDIAHLKEALSYRCFERLLAHLAK